MKRSQPMRRTGMRKQPPERERTVHTPGTGRGSMVRVGDEVVSVPKDARVLDEDYRRWVATLPCIRCGIVGFSQAAHPNFGRGLGQKADDTDCFPLCCDQPGRLGCHSVHDQLIGITLTERRERERLYVGEMRALRGDPTKHGQQP